MIRINEIIDKVSGYMSEADLDLIRKAYVFSATAHAGQTRLSGEPYLSHPLEAANILAELRLDAATVCAGLLHDTVEDTKATVDGIEEDFGEEVADIVDGVTKISQISFESKEEAQAENIRKMILAMAEDIRVVLVKLADRLHNMRTLDYQKPAKQALIAQETMDIYAPLANRLGLHRVKIELEDLSFKYLKPEVFAQIRDGLTRHHTLGEAYIEQVIAQINELLAKNGIRGRIQGRKKHIFSIFNKMRQQGLSLDQVHDLIAFRVIVDGLKDCYAVLGLVHSIWKPVHGRFKDYISMPKANMYQSLHTTVIGPDGERIEIQIRTEEMNRLAEEGVAAHWQYKERGKGRFSPKDIDRFTWLRQIMDWQRELKDSREFMATLRIDLFQDEVYVFTPKGQVKEMPEGATPVDFAYMIHTAVGDHCAGAKINGRLSPLTTALKNGDAVEIITDANRTPSRDWLKFVKTAKARTRIKHWIRTEERARSIALGKEMLEKQGRKDGVNIQKAIKDGSLRAVAEEMSLGGVDELFSAVGYVRVTAKKIIGRLLPARPEMTKAEAEAEAVAVAAAAATQAKTKSSDAIRIQGVDNVLVRYAQCCNPLPGDHIVGYVSRGRGVTIHTHDCPNVQGFEPERLLRVSWEGEEERPYPARMRILAKNIKGVLGRISVMLAAEGVNIDSGAIHSSVDGTTEILFTVEVTDTSHLYRTIERVSTLDEVIEVKRLAISGPAVEYGKAESESLPDGAGEP
ncbi:bifunctional (p)ppGpp synthetase/guanosine-3',5'-bis(diphosphate) 3'-pyrophosphohydrolase [Desulfovibrio sulfodismutans]|uniref:Bifunctional (P)ppGpp synthetase/guanosine-3',5'-bis(Diphosphate) 3'-pyrophosphohydrolase n=1 Tax=Desulfolutivibrio sulfodismutans TaxID=63561 RepID=A0A7K3NLX5_9BACT|nr:bifunctional (p)ppGpp synthetase/guanosine-3',5'-bis(diphosphate) 3'-pyrophosphohydrolase [Desulfolutivibrio sulfodismutans]NDY57200.1 bifunctional (p)ppGpp synthetase/guanosine-3',5'-bis(diphosphate) 3'-pyrophosphohydrolase [Desulfolutivibrio sulfodismutans]QLA13858.1 RelA/SpoT family protein [Desulfolutivibrio sulfodismutans DSM 3696]